MNRTGLAMMIGHALSAKLETKESMADILMASGIRSNLAEDVACGRRSICKIQMHAGIPRMVEMVRDILVDRHGEMAFVSALDSVSTPHLDRAIRFTKHMIDQGKRFDEKFRQKYGLGA